MFLPPLAHPPWRPTTPQQSCPLNNLARLPTLAVPRVSRNAERRFFPKSGYGFSSKPDPGPWEERNAIYSFETWSEQVGSWPTEPQFLFERPCYIFHALYP